MPSYMYGDYFNTLVSTHFPGGKLGWVRASGDACFIPVPTDRDILYILLPSEKTKDLDLEPFKQAVEKACKARRVLVRWVDNPAFTDAFDILRFATFAASRNRPVYLSVRRAVVIITLPEDTKEQATEFLDLMAPFKISRVLIVGSSFALEGVYEAPAESLATPVPPRAVKNHVITQADVVDLTILIENARTVEDLLKAL